LTNVRSMEGLGFTLHLCLLSDEKIGIECLEGRYVRGVLIFAWPFEPRKMVCRVCAARSNSRNRTGSISLMRTFARWKGQASLLNSLRMLEEVTLYPSERYNASAPGL